MSETPQVAPQLRGTEETVVLLLRLMTQLVRELHPTRGGAVTLESTLERDLGLDSLGRMELLARLERALDMRLPEHLLATADTVRDLLLAVQQSSASALPAPRFEGRPAIPEGAIPEDTEAPPLQASTLVEVLDWHVRAHPHRRHIILIGAAGETADLTYAALYEGATAVAASLQARDLQPGHTVALMLPTCRDFFTNFYGILLAGGIPVPIYPPQRPSQLEDHLRRQASILHNARTTTLITVPEAQPLARLLSAQVTGLRHVLTTHDLATAATAVRPGLHAQDIALLQYTSGSTGTPKGVILTHANLLANIRAMGQATGATAADVFVSWLPLYHDLGLIGAWLGSLYYAQLLVLLSPLTFLARPERWLWAIHTHRGTISGAPNFAYELCAHTIDDRALAGLDLSTWRLAFTGAEPVSPETMQRFGARFARYGFRPAALTPVYGLAEATLGLTFPPRGRGPRLDRIQRKPFTRTGQAVPAAEDDPHAVCVVSCGLPLPGAQVRIVDATGLEVPERQQGRLEFQGPSATRGYFHNPDETRRLFHGTWLDSGDLAYIADGEVFLTGRVKDLIIRAGRNVYPQELEETIGVLAGIEKGGVAVFGSPDPVSVTERLVVLAETRARDPAVLATLRQQIEAVAIDLLGSPPDEVVLAPPQSVLKTASGKIRRAATRDVYASGKLGARPAPVWWQWTRLAVAGILPQVHRLQRQTAVYLYAACVWTLVGLLTPVAWLAVVLVPRRHWRHTIVRGLVRLVLRLAGVSLVVQGLEHLPQHQPCVLVVNHASYLDVFVLLAVLPGDLSYVAKQELADHGLLRLPLQRLGTVFVERFAAQRSVEDTARVVQVVHQGQAVVFFPEGTFESEPGVRPFHMGAFLVAVQAGCPIVPLALRGTRALLRAGQWYPRRGVVRLTIGTPCAPQGPAWAAAVQLRDAARAHILRYGGEPDLELAVAVTGSGAGPG
jgi:1-acyl-sn-glycerol-3-phosphate acyltransferase